MNRRVAILGGGVGGLSAAHELVKHGWRSCFYLGPNRPFVDAWTWAVLIEPE